MGRIVMGRGGNSIDRWIEENVREQQGIITLITGANSGIGLEAARIMASKGAVVIMACRNLEKSEAAYELVKTESPGGTVELMKLDLADFSSIKTFADNIRSRFERINILVNNAGIMATPYSKTRDGFEMQFGTNHLGHFLLTALLLDMITHVKGSRVVTTSSIAHFKGIINFDDLNSVDGYNRMEAYRQSKLANLLFAYELQSRFVEAGKETISVSVHPGISSTSIVDLSPLLEKLKDLVLMNPVKGALPIIMGATNRSLIGGEFIGPDGFRQMYGFPSIRDSSQLSKDKDLSRRLWSVSEELTGMKYKI